MNLFPLTAWSKVCENRLCVTICAFIHLEIGYPSSASSGIQILHGSIALAKELFGLE